MTTEEKKTEEKILDAAKMVFVRKGYAATSMQEIADEAGINKALLHYYYRSKDKLFEATFKVVLKRFIPRTLDILKSSRPFNEKIELFVENYITLLVENPLIPIFILQELNRNPDSLAEIMKSTGLNPQIILQILKAAVDQGKISEIDPRQLMVNLLSLCIFPVAARPLIQYMFFDNDQAEFDRFLQERKKEVSKFIIHAINQK